MSRVCASVCMLYGQTRGSIRLTFRKFLLSVSMCARPVPRSAGKMRNRKRALPNHNNVGEYLKNIHIAARRRERWPYSCDAPFELLTIRPGARCLASCAVRQRLCYCALNSTAVVKRENLLSMARAPSFFVYFFF